jgi:two-component sensor histidine kinase
MAHVHTLLSQNHWEGIDFAELVRHQLAPDGTDANTIIDGPKVMLTVEATQALAMVLHELVTNAAKYGALSTPHGRVEVEWNRGAGEEVANLLIAWREIGGPAVAALPTCGYGVSIIRNLISQELGGSVDLAFASGGVCCNIRIPLEPARDAGR